MILLTEVALVAATRFKEYKSPRRSPSTIGPLTGLQNCTLFIGGLIWQSMETHTLPKAFSFVKVTMIGYFRVLHYPVDSTYVSTR